MNTKQILGDSEGRLLEQMEAVLGNTYQQSINCGQTTAVAYALTTLGYETKVDDILLAVQVNIESVVGDGMTLSETHDLALRYINIANLPIFCECYHFDKQSRITQDDFWEACLLDGDGGNDDVCVINFDTAIAHNKKKGQGHFALIVGPLKNKKELLISDVDPLNYGAIWKQNYKQIFKAISEKDLCGRSRGMLRFGLINSKDLECPFPSLANAQRLVDWVNPSSPYKKEKLKKYIPEKWDAHLGTTNMEGISSVAKALDVLDNLNEWSLDDVMRVMKESYTYHLNQFMVPENLFNLFLRLSKKKNIYTVPSMITVGKNLNGNILKKILLDNGMGQLGVEFLINFNYSVAYDGKSKKKKTKSNSEIIYSNRILYENLTWSMIADIDPEASKENPYGVIIASTHNVIAYGRLWRTSLDNLAKAIKETKSNFIIKVEYIDDRSEISQQQKIDKLIAILDKDNDGVITSSELVQGFKNEGIDLTMDDAKELINEVDADDNKVLDRSEAISLFAKVLGLQNKNNDFTNKKSFAKIGNFLDKFGCYPNDMGFSTVHLAIKTSNVRACIEFYNNILGWPLYKTVDRSHAGLEEDSYGSSWASFGTFSSLIVFHHDEVPIGSAGHGPWSRKNECPTGLYSENNQENLITNDDEMTQLLNNKFMSISNQIESKSTLTFNEIPFPFHGVILEPSFYKKQMNRIVKKNKNKKIKWMHIDGAENLFGGNLIKDAIVFCDPDGYALVFFLSKLEGKEFKKRFSVTPIVYGQNIFVAFPNDPEQKAEMEKTYLAIKQDSILGEYGKYVKNGNRKQRDIWLNEHFFNNDSLKQHENHYEKILGWKKLAKVIDDDKKIVQLEYELEGHFLICRNSLENNALKNIEGSHDMGGNKGYVPVPHYGINTDYLKFSMMRDSVKCAVEKHGLPEDVCRSLLKYGFGPTFDWINPFDSLFPTDPDTCMSLLCNDPSGNVSEMKWYLDFGEMFHNRGAVGLNELIIDNSMIDDHFPQDVLEILKKRSKKN